MEEPRDPSDPASRFAAEKGEPGVLDEALAWMGSNKKWWLLPIVLALVLAGLFAAAGSSIAPFLYDLF